MKEAESSKSAPTEHERDTMFSVSILAEKEREKRRKKCCCDWCVATEQRRDPGKHLQSGI